MKCSVCGGKAGLTASRTKNGDWLCSKCFKKAGGLKTWMQVSQMPLGAIIEKVNGSVESTTANVPQNSVQPQEANISIIPTKVIGNNLMLIDEKNQKVQFPRNEYQRCTEKLYRCSQWQYGYIQFFGYYWI